MKGYWKEQIAAKLDCDLRTEERKLGVNSHLWQEYHDERRNGKE
jgi:hypothetical protein